MKTIPLDSLARSIMLGTGTDKLSPVLEGVDSNYTDSESRLLISAAISGLAEIGGRLPILIETQDAISRGESEPPLPEKAARLLKRILGGEHEEVLGEFLQITAERGFVVPPETLPALLGLGKNRLLKPVATVMGERGRWLASQNPTWAQAFFAISKDGWETSPFEARLLLLDQLRETVPEDALQLVWSTWEQDPPEERAAFLNALAVGLSMADEPFLENCLDDRRKEIREAATDCLVRLPDSRLVLRNINRLEELLLLKSQFLGGDGLDVTLPEKLDSAAKRDGVGGAVLRKDLGEKANWLAQLLSLVPPTCWGRKWNRSAEKLIHSALGSEWKEAILLGWTLATIRCGDPEWAAALATAAIKQNEVRKSLGESDWTALSKFMPVGKVESLAQSTIIPGSSELHDNHPILGLLESYPHPWSAKLARTVMGSLKRDASAARWRLAQILPIFGLRIPADLADEFGAGWPKRPGWDAAIDRFVAVMHFRKEMMEAL